MDNRASSGLAGHYAAAIDWWREAGVDQQFHDEPAGWLSEPQAEPAQIAPTASQMLTSAPVATAAPAAPRIGGDRANWPATLADFHGWWLAEPSLAPAGTRMPPRGSVNPELLVLVPMPEAGDSDLLLSGTQGTLVANMLRAMGIAPEAAYIASALPRYLPLADWPGLHADGLGDVLAHHIGLVAPRRLLVLGNDILPLLGLEKRQGVRDLPLNGEAIQLLASYAPENLLDNPKARAALWRRWLEWTQDT